MSEQPTIIAGNFPEDAVGGNLVNEAAVPEPYDYPDLFTTTIPVRHYLDPREQAWVDIKVMNEGARANYEKDTRQDTKLNTKTQDMTLSLDQAQDRHALFNAAIEGWNISRKDPASGKLVPIPYAAKQVKEFLIDVNPKVLDGIIEAIRDVNPWLKNEMSIKDIDDAIERLQEDREQAVAKERAKKS